MYPSRKPIGVRILYTGKGGKLMAIVNKDEVKGKYEQVKGTIKDKVGEATGNERLEAEGEVQHAEGEVQQTWGEAKRKVSNVIEDVADAVNR